ncbi:MAG: adenine deaminase [Bacteroidales bacterium]
MEKKFERIEGQLVDIFNERVIPARVEFSRGGIVSVTEIPNAPAQYILPGFVDAHVHIESSMLTPVEFSRVALRHGTLAAISDPHEIANVLGVEGVRFMVENGKRTPFRFLFGAPSCVPATPFDHSGACLDAGALEEVLSMEGVGFLAEMMNFPGVLSREEEVMAKLALARRMHLPIDGHAPGLTGPDLKSYVAEGILTDHECEDLKEAEEKAGLGMHILIREGSGAKNFDSLLPLLDSFPEQVMFCTDDAHPDDLLTGHINQLVRRAILKKYDLFKVLRAASLNVARHYGLDMGFLRPQDRADFIVVDSLEEFGIKTCFLDGEVVYSEKGDKVSFVKAECPNNFLQRDLPAGSLSVVASEQPVRIIQALDGKLYTKEDRTILPSIQGLMRTDPERDLLKIALVNRYDRSISPAIGFIRGFGLKRGAIASSIAHDAHNLISVGVDDESMLRCFAWLNEQKGGIVIDDGEVREGLALPIAGLMSPEPAERVAEAYQQLNRRAKELGSELHAPFMTLAFMALVVIPELKLGDLGLFDVQSFQYTTLFETT